MCTENRARESNLLRWQWHYPTKKSDRCFSTDYSQQGITPSSETIPTLSPEISRNALKYETKYLDFTAFYSIAITHVDGTAGRFLASKSEQVDQRQWLREFLIDGDLDDVFQWISGEREFQGVQCIPRRSRWEYPVASREFPNTFEENYAICLVEDTQQSKTDELSDGNEPAMTRMGVA